MKKLTFFTNWEKYQNAAHTLNRQAYEQQLSKKNGKRFRFQPCPKGDVFIQGCDYGQVAFEVTQRAALTICTCHNDLNESQLIDLMYDDTERMIHYGNACRVSLGEN